MSDFKKCDNCGTSADVEKNRHNPMHLHAPVGWGQVTFDIQRAVDRSMAYLEGPWGGPVGPWGGETSSGDFAGDSSGEATQQGVLVQSRLDLCPDCLEKMIAASGCVDQIRREVTPQANNMFRGHGRRPVGLGPRGPGGHLVAVSPVGRPPSKKD